MARKRRVKSRSAPAEKMAEISPEVREAFVGTDAPDEVLEEISTELDREAEAWIKAVATARRGEDKPIEAKASKDKRKKAR